MNTKQKGPLPPPSAITLRDVYYVFFKHKWLIASLLAIGVAASFAVELLWPFPYVSRAKIYVRYIQDTMAPTEVDGGAKLKSPDEHGANVLNTELQILTSTDLLLQVVTNVGADRILGKSGSSNNIGAAALIGEHLNAEVEPNSDVISLKYSATSPDVVQQVLLSLISVYKSKYYEIHLAPGVSDDYLEKRTDDANDNLQQALKTLKEVKIRTGITSLDDAKKNQANLYAKTKEEIFNTQSELAEADANIKDLQEQVAGSAIRVSVTNRATNTAAVAPQAPPSQEVVAKYQMLRRILDSDRAREQDLLVQFTTNNVKVQGVQQQLKEAEADVQKFELENPGVVAYKPTELGRPEASLAQTLDPVIMLRDAVTKRHSLTAKYLELTNQMARIRAETAELDGTEEQIVKAQSDTETAEAKLKRYQLSIEQNNIDEAVGNKVSNISTIEMPTPPGHDAKAVPKVIWGITAGFVLLAFGLPLFIELVLDQSLKHPSDVQNRIEGVPFFITLPKMRSQRKQRAIEKSLVVSQLAANGSGSPGDSPDSPERATASFSNGHLAPWDQRHELRPFYETLRDRMMTYFEMVNLTHKPKLVAVTSCGEGAGVTTTAAGLASSLSETGEGNVLLVSMNVGDGEAQHFYKGKLAVGIEEVLGKEKRGPAQVNENLFFAHELGADDKLPRMLPKRFSHLVPMMKASDFDYIIFDMPPIDEISITPRLARFMDMVLLVIESEKTSRDTAARAAAMLKETKTNVGLVLNKNRSYVPKRLEQTL